ncbi:MAG: AraC family transcriptional regulator [Firmicutes bacterium]|nr:AraC family transcriptional regulator [Bacillota bacterium]
MPQFTTENQNLPELTRQAAALIREHFMELYGVEELSEALGVSKSHLVRSFSANLGLTPGRYLTKMRVEAVKALLLRGDYTLETIAGLCGFSGANYLCKVFKKECGLTPTRWRERYAGALSDLPPEGWEGKFYVW